MNGVRTEWHLADAHQEDEDPFGEVVYSGIDIDLTGTEEELAQAYKRLLLMEGRLEKVGLRCELKDNGQDCLTCPVATLEASEPRSRLCRLGKDQYTVERAYEQAQGEHRGELIELAEFTDELIELGELPDDLAELLTSVGL